MADGNGNWSKEGELSKSEARARLFERLEAMKLPGPWTEADDLVLEYLTEEPQGRPHASRDADL